MPPIGFAVILPAYNEAAHIGAAIDSVRACAQEDIGLEIVVVDNLSTDGTPAIAARHGAKVIENLTGKRKTIAALRNEGARATTARILAFLDADMIVPEDWLMQAAKRFEFDAMSALGFAEQVPEDATWVGRAWGNRSEAPATDLATDFLPGRNLLVTRAAFDAVNGFDEELTTCEDKDFTLRLVKSGRHVFRSPATRVTHLGYERGIIEFVRKEFWRQSTTWAFARRHCFSWRTLRNPLMSLWHVLFATAFAWSILGGTAGGMVVSAALWLLPSALFTLRDATCMCHCRNLPGVFVLTFLRWNVSGAALVWQALQRKPSRLTGASGP